MRSTIVSLSERRGQRQSSVDVQGSCLLLVVAALGVLYNVDVMFRHHWDKRPFGQLLVTKDSGGRVCPFIFLKYINAFML